MTGMYPISFRGLVFHAMTTCRAERPVTGGLVITPK